MAPSDPVASYTSPLQSGAEDLIDNALWLIAGHRYSQAMSALHNAIELLFKSELERIHPVLLAITEKVTYTQLKSFLRSSFQTHHKGAALSIDDIDFERTIGFTEVTKRIKDIYPEVQRWDGRLAALQKARNQIMHAGRASYPEAECVRLIATVAFPFLDEFLPLSVNKTLSAVIGAAVYREVDIARRFCEHVAAHNEGDYGSALKTVQRTMLYRRVSFPVPFDDQGWVEDNYERESATARSIRNALRGHWEGHIVEVCCTICDSIHAFAEVDGVDEDGPFNDGMPLSLACAVCGLMLSRHDGPLAELHYGKVSAADIEKAIANLYRI